MLHGEDTQSSEDIRTSTIGRLIIFFSWINGHEEEYGFGFKALVCHDGVFDTTYNGLSTDELFFVSAPCPHSCLTSLMSQLVQS